MSAIQQTEKPVKKLSLKHSAKAPELKNKVCFKGECISVEIARTMDEQTRGLQGRESLADHTGMLFIFDTPQPYRFWMKDTLIPLDMIWLNSNQHVVYVSANVPPCKNMPCATYGPSVSAQYVLELNANSAAALGIKVGSKAEFQLE